LVGDDVGEQAAHVGQHVRVGDEFGEQVVFALWVCTQQSRDAPRLLGLLRYGEERAEGM